MKTDSWIKTVGRWPWRLESAKKRVITYLSNSGLVKMDGGDLQYEALDAMRSRLVWLFLRSMWAIVYGGVFRADLGSSSKMKFVYWDGFILWDRRRLFGAYVKGKNVEIHLMGIYVVTRMRDWSDGVLSKFSVFRDVRKVMLRGRLSSTMKKNILSRTEPHQGSVVRSQIQKEKSSKGNRQNRWVTLGKLLALAC